MWSSIILLILLFFAVWWSIREKRKTYRRIDELLDRVLNQEIILDSDVKEGEYSALVSKIKQIQEEIGRAHV